MQAPEAGWESAPAPAKSGRMFERQLAADLDSPEPTLSLTVGDGWPCSRLQLLQWLDLLCELAHPVTAAKAGTPVDPDQLPKWLQAGQLDPDTRTEAELLASVRDGSPRHPFDCIVSLTMAGLAWTTNFCDSASRDLDSSPADPTVARDLEQAVVTLGTRLGEDIHLRGSVGPLLRWRSDRAELEYLGLQQPTTCCRSLAAPSLTPFVEVEGYGYYDGSTSGLHRCGTCGRLWLFERAAQLVATIEEVLVLAPYEGTTPADWEALRARPAEPVLACTAVWFGEQARLTGVLGNPAGRPWQDVADEGARSRGDRLHFVFPGDGVILSR